MHGEIGHNGGPTSGNWIAISREMRNHPIVGMGQPVKPADPSRGSYSKYEAWQDLLMEAKWKPFEIRNKGKMVTLERGQLMAARAWLASRWNWTDKTVRVFLAALENDLMIRTEKGQSEGQSQGQSNAGGKGQRSGHYSNILTISNYNIYQTVLELMDLSEGQSKADSEARAGARGRANQGPESNKETNKQNTTLHAQATAPRTREDLDRLQQRLLEAANGALADPAAAPGLLSLAEPIRWLENGFDLELDIVPTIRSRAHNQRPRAIRAWSFFTEAIREAKAARHRPLSAASPPIGADHSPRRSFAQQRADAERESLNRDVERIRKLGPARPLCEQIEELGDLP